MVWLATTPSCKTCLSHGIVPPHMYPCDPVCASSITRLTAAVGFRRWAPEAIPQQQQAATAAAAEPHCLHAPAALQTKLLAVGWARLIPAHAHALAPLFDFQPFRLQHPPLLMKSQKRFSIKLSISRTTVVRLTLTDTWSNPRLNNNAESSHTSGAT